jgi:hypothetical protein
MYPVRLALPSHTNIGKKCIYVGPAYEGIPYPIAPVSLADEQCIIEGFVEEINKLFMTELATELRHVRVIEASEDDFETGMRGKRFILVGSSHLARLAFALEDQEGTVVDLSVPGWRATADSMEAMLHQLKSVLHEDYGGETVIIYQLFDNSYFLYCDEEGSRGLLVKATGQGQGPPVPHPRETRHGQQGQVQEHLHYNSAASESWTGQHQNSAIATDALHCEQVLR